MQLMKCAVRTKIWCRMLSAISEAIGQTISSKVWLGTFFVVVLTNHAQTSGIETLVIAAKNMAKNAQKTSHGVLPKCPLRNASTSENFGGVRFLYECDIEKLCFPTCALCNMKYIA